MSNKEHTVPEDNGELLNLEQPLFSEVWRVGENYEEWVHKPSMKKSFRMFHLDFVEMFSSTPWYVVPIFWTPVIMWFGMSSMGKFADPSLIHTDSTFNSNSSTSPNLFRPILTNDPLNMFQLLIHILMGLVEWTFMEYVLHRFLFHTPVNGNSPLLITAHFVLHGQHHKFPMDKGRLVFPVIPAIGVCTGVYWCFTRLLFTFFPAFGVQCGFLIGYVCYDLTHYYTHFGHPTFGYLAKLKKSHMKHHFKNINHGYGISSEIWDYVFGTQWPEETTKTK
eukprot:m.144348 g.144348  ORF g.144348 m.144348 type:complete len:278 (-) comp30367_c0_seq2:178-1011(-)